MKKLLILFFLVVATTAAKAEDLVAFFFFNNLDTTIVEDDFMKMEVCYYYSGFGKKEIPTFTVKLYVTNKSEQPLYIDKGNSFFYENRTSYCMYEDKTTTKGNVETTEKRIEPVPPESRMELWSYQFSDEARKTEYAEAKWYIGLVPKKKAKPGYTRNFTEDDTPLKVRAIVSYGLAEDMSDAKQIESESYAQMLIVDKAPDPVRIIEKQKKKGSGLKKLLRASNRWVSYKFNFKKCTYAINNKNAFWYRPAPECYDSTVKMKRKDKKNSKYIR